MESSLRRAPKDPKENVAYRRAILMRARGDREFQDECWARCMRDPIWEVDTFGWTVNPMDFPLCPDRPMILYDFQEDLFKNLYDAVTSESATRTDRLIEKSRKMGATWVIEYVAKHLWKYYSGQSILFGSNKEDNVDMQGNPASLLGKIDVMIDREPGWFRPRYSRVKLLFTNLDNGSIIKGESTNDNFARSGRFGLIFMDEFAAVEHGIKLLAATQAASRTRIICSTHQGAQTAFNQLCQKWKAETPERVIRETWHKHPDYRKGMYTSVQDDYGRFVLKILDESYEWPKSTDGTNTYPFILDGKERSPWYDEEERSSPNEQVMAQEVDCNPATSSSQLVHPDKLTAIMVRSARPARHVGEMVYDGDGLNPKFSPSDNGRFRLWCELDSHGRPPEGKYGVTCDVAFGNGGDRSSNSAATVVNRTTGSKVAEFAWFAITPQDFAVYATAISRFFDEAPILWELPGPGAQFWSKLKEIRYPFLYEIPGSEGRRGGMKYGWQPSKEGKKNLLESYAYALHNGMFDNPSKEALLEVSEYERQTDKNIVHVKSARATNPDVAGENHGDRVIADALAYMMVDEQPRTKDLKDLMAHPPENTYAWRQKEARDKLRRTGRYGTRRHR